MIQNLNNSSVVLSCWIIVWITTKSLDQLSEHLIAGAASTNADKDVGDDLDENELPPAITVQAPSGPLTITIPSLNLATLSPQATQVKRICIPLKILFDYELFLERRDQELGKRDGSLQYMTFIMCISMLYSYTRLRQSSTPQDIPNIEISHPLTDHDI